jgi:hypothetical protein
MALNIKPLMPLDHPSPPERVKTFKVKACSPQVIEVREYNLNEKAKRNEEFFDNSRKSIEKRNIIGKNRFLMLKKLDII